MTLGAPPTDDPVLGPYDTPDHPLAAWFEWKRQRRREHYARRGPLTRPRRSAVLTIVSNEPVFFPIWLGYYSRYFAPEDMYVLDHDTTDGSTAGEGFVRIPVSHDLFDNRWMVANVEEQQRRLLERYDAVLVVDVDEIVAPIPSHGTLGDYLARFDEDWVNCLGYEILHRRDREPPFNPERPVLEQRGYWYAHGAYNKPSLASVPLRWKPGFHSRADNHFNFDPDLRLIHLHRMDYDVCRSRHLKWSARRWNPRDVDEGWGVHNRIAEEDEFDRWFDDVQVPHVTASVEEIQPDWRGVV